VHRNNWQHDSFILTVSSPSTLSKPWEHSCTVVRETLLDLSAATLMYVRPVLHLHPVEEPRRGNTGSTSTRLIAHSKYHPRRISFKSQYARAENIEAC
jgi:hypothetical protein